jgi:hypothetical protein
MSTDAFTNVFGASRGPAVGAPSGAGDGRPAPMTVDQALATVKFLAPELAKRAAARTTAWRNGPPAGWVLAYLVYLSADGPDLKRWCHARGPEFWSECGLPGTPTAADVSRFFGGMDEQFVDAPTTVRSLALLIADLAACGVAPVTRIDPHSLKTVRAPAAIKTT